MVNHLTKLFPALAERTKPLEGPLHHDATWHWGKDQQQAFEGIEEALTTTPVFVHYNPRIT